MADVGFVLGELEILTGSRTRNVRAGTEAIAQFDWVYLNGAVYELASNTTDVKSRTAGMAISRSPASGYFTIIYSGGFKTVTAEFDADEVYVLSAPGKMAPDIDKATNDWLTTLGRAVSTTEFRIDISAHGYQGA